MNNSRTKVLLIIIILAAVAAVCWYYYQNSKPKVDPVVQYRQNLLKGLNGNSSLGDAPAYTPQERQKMVNSLSAATPNGAPAPEAKPLTPVQQKALIDSRLKMVQSLGQ